MITLFRKMAVVALLTTGVSAMAAGNLNLSVAVTGSVVTSCEADQTIYELDFGQVSGLTVGKASTDFFITCSAGVEYTIKPNTDFVSAGGGYSVIKPYQDAAYSIPMTTTSYLTVTGTGSEQQIPVYFKLSSDHQYNMNGIDRGEGNILQEAGLITGNAEVFNFTFEYN